MNNKDMIDTFSNTLMVTSDCLIRHLKCYIAFADVDLEEDDDEYKELVKDIDKNKSDMAECIVLLRYLMDYLEVICDLGGNIELSKMSLEYEIREKIEKVINQSISNDWREGK